MKTQKTQLVRIALICIVAACCVLPVMAEDVTVSREIDPSTVSAGDQVQVRISVDGMATGGIVETIPDGCTFLSTTYPEEKYRVSGNTVLFSVIDDRTITYQVRAEKDGVWTFSGTWDDTFNKTDGTIPESRLTVGEGSSAGSAETPAVSGTTAARSGPAAAVLIGIPAIALLAAGAWCRRSRP